MYIENPILTQIAITMLPKLNSGLYHPLIERCGGIYGFFSEPEKIMDTIYQEFNIPPNYFNRKEAIQKAEKELELISKHHINICSVENHNYPHLLRQCEDFPIVFYYKGEPFSPDEHKFLAIVGTRHSSIKYQEKIDTIIEELSLYQTPLTIVSGLAYGIDAAAHRACLKHGIRTFAVLGNGLHTVYPATHKKMADNILETKGTLISEFPCSSRIFPNHFLRRNRIIAGLCHATLVAESALKGGAMSTAHFALSYNREVMAIPGRFDDTYSAGCNQLIKENTAALVENSKDIAQILGIQKIEKQKAPVPLTLFDFQQEEKLEMLLRTLQKQGESSMDELIYLTNIPQKELTALLLQLELEDKIFSLPGKQYSYKKRN